MGAVTGTPVVAVVDGFMRHDVGGDGGNGAWLMGIDHVNYYYAHFSHYEGDARHREGRRRDRVRGDDRQCDRSAPALRGAPGRRPAGRPVRHAAHAVHRRSAARTTDDEHLAPQ